MLLNRGLSTLSCVVAVTVAGLYGMAQHILAKPVQPALSHREKPVLTIKGLNFRDLNGDGKLEPYEDWRLSPVARARDLVGRMTIDEKIGLMVIGTQQMGSSTGGSVARGCKGPKSADGLLCEARVEETTNMFAAPDSPTYTYLKPVVRTLPTSEGIQKYGVRRYIVRENPDASALTIWTNRVQEVAEQSRLGIPVVFTSNPRNHASSDLAVGFSEAAGQFSTWPGTLGLAATNDLPLIGEFAKIARQEWDATGLRAGYMYQADIATDPRWFRIDGTFGDDPQKVARIIATIVTGFQGSTLSQGGVLMTTKHFPGGGPRDRGTDPHYYYGTASPYPTPASLATYHLPSFASAIESGTAAIMPYYALPQNSRSVPQLKDGKPFEEVGFSYNKGIVQDLLRTQMGFKGYVNSDSGILFSMPWGESIMKMDFAERAAAAINVGVDVISDMQDTGIIRAAYDRHLVTEERISLSVQRLLEPMFAIGLFENPYRDPAAARDIVQNPEHWQKAYRAHQESTVLLKNLDGLLPLTDAKLQGKKIYIECLGQGRKTEDLLASLRKSNPGVNFTTDLSEAGFALLFINAADKRDRKSPVIFDLEIHPQTSVSVTRVQTIESKVPTIISVNMEMPWLLGSIEPKAAAVLAGFSTRPDAIFDVVRGAFHPVGKLPFTLPRNIQVVEKAETTGPAKSNGATASDVPGFVRPAGDDYVYVDAKGASYRTGFGMNY
jgi:beta-glucosidase